ncbi:hypothetical protein HYH03_001979 [Edaphochlamys debaryana]|uniref:Uncharacterized protein n=1 Tax=Edaphochlamys debaryana TaxID=47281 RepID=A0A835YFS1_9CHLO|nr:hypothetical protein HYH03_001979 [Edaphochlamys debaryana]|eukprot:KAG2500408.1 hypothetical protein HYH03_001979 [Edaphochlamys debaryana]
MALSRRRQPLTLLAVAALLIASGQWVAPAFGQTTAGPWGVFRFADPLAQWIWSAPGAASDAPTDVVSVFSRVLTLDEPTHAAMSIMVDSYADVWLNGAYVGSASTGWPLSGRASAVLRVTLVSGRNTLVVRATNTPQLGPTGAPPGTLAGPGGAQEGPGGGNPAGLLLTVISSDGNFLARSDETWDVTKSTSAPAPSAAVAVPATELGSWTPPKTGANATARSFPDPLARWIGPAPGSSGSGDATLTLAFRYTAAAATTGTLYLVPSSHADVFLNDTYLASLEWADTALTTGPCPSLTLPLAAGTNSLALRTSVAANVPPPGGGAGVPMVLAALVVEGVGVMRSDDSWVVAPSLAPVVAATGKRAPGWVGRPRRSPKPPSRPSRPPPRPKRERKKTKNKGSPSPGPSPGPEPSPGPAGRRQLRH